MATKITTGILVSVCLMSICSRVCGDEEITDRRFPESFKFGVASAAYQIEGAWDEDGKGENMWDRFLHDNASRTTDGKNADIACDSYHKWREDVRLLTELGVSIYRFSISWSRILPDGTTNKINQAGVDYYLNLLQVSNLLIKKFSIILCGKGSPLISLGFSSPGSPAYHII
ncbi:myrosinase 1-like [Dendroctonus ponderosae]|uniref:myrosinase 1-like n=1 Tax=Dendroctonus ponderosae TaxID=77166 RepID=UPI002035605E|nr:myrosinase 1-like [Dendroctonus ponderosae]